MGAETQVVAAVVGGFTVKTVLRAQEVPPPPQTPQASRPALQQLPSAPRRSPTPQHTPLRDTARADGEEDKEDAASASASVRHRPQGARPWAQQALPSLSTTPVGQQSPLTVRTAEAQQLPSLSRTVAHAAEASQKAPVAPDAQTQAAPLTAQLPRPEQGGEVIWQGDGAR
jgi:hypothetical protein